jgi:hypothetical protein
MLCESARYGRAEQAFGFLEQKENGCKPDVQLALRCPETMAINPA